MNAARIAPRTRSILGAALVAAAVLLAAAPTEALAADIVVKQVTIRKRGVGRAQVGGVELVGRVDVGDLAVTTTTETRYQDPGGRVSQAAAKFAFVVAAKDGAVVTKAALDVTLTDCAGATQVQRVDVTPAETGFTAQFRLPEYTTCPWRLTHETLLLTDQGGAVRAFESVDETPKDPCAATSAPGTIGFTTTAPKDGPATLGIRFDFEVGPDAPGRSDMLVQLTNCKAQKTTVRVGIEGLDGRSVGIASVPQEASCPWVLTYGELYVDSPCGEVATWAIDFAGASPAKTNGTGTRGAASTAPTAKPTLK